MVTFDHNPGLRGLVVARHPLGFDTCYRPGPARSFRYRDPNRRASRGADLRACPRQAVARTSPGPEQTSLARLAVVFPPPLGPAVGGAGAPCTHERYAAAWAPVSDLPISLRDRRCAGRVTAGTCWPARRSTHVLARDHVRVDPVVPEAVAVIILGCAGQPSWRRSQARTSSQTGQCLTPSSGNSSLGPGVNPRSRS